MKKVRVEEAVGLTLCHDITAVRDGFKGAAFKRGHVITGEDIPKLLDIGKQNIFIWEENAGEIHEEDAARRMAAMCPVEGAHYTDVSEGKVLLVSDIRGQLRVDTELLRKINSIGDITISTIAGHYPVEPGTKIAGMRIVPLVTKEQQIIDAEEMCRGKKLLEIRPYKSLKVGVVITGSEVYNGRIKDKFEPVVREKLKSFPSEIIKVKLCDDELSMLSSSIEELIALGADFIIMTGGMSVDPDDLTPTAIAGTGAEVIVKGIPSQPGNMFMLAYKGGITIIGVPGAAIHARTTIFDVVLPQIFTGDRFTKEDFVRLGDGGLCMQCRQCHFPNCTFGRY